MSKASKRKPTKAELAALSRSARRVYNAAFDVYLQDVERVETPADIALDRAFTRYVALLDAFYNDESGYDETVAPVLVDPRRARKRKRVTPARTR